MATRSRALPAARQDRLVVWYQIESDRDYYYVSDRWYYGVDGDLSSCLGGCFPGFGGQPGDHYWFAVGGRDGYAATRAEAMEQVMLAVLEMSIGNRS